MVLPIPLGTLLRQRYLIQQVLGQGGFGRTYLALDQERFNEKCVIKEFVVPYNDDALVEKSKTLFQREATILYQIQHPQIPRFWAAFEDEQRLFLVQDFVDGQTYRHLLSDRKQHGQTFAEAEVRHFLFHLLPVLSYIHDRDIVHRDISPENVILQLQSVTQVEPASNSTLGLPVLIDFGAVKEATSHWPLMTAPTRVGKVGYAPPEQLQTGKVYPNSDLYALGASCLVLLTSREPQTLLDSRTLSWRWESYTSISEELGMILRKMLAVYPGDRYQSAREVLADLQPIIQTAPESTLLQSSPANSIYSETSGYSTETKLPEVFPSMPLMAAQVSQSNQQHARPTVVESYLQKVRSQSPAQWNHHFSSKLRLGLAAASLAALGVATPLLWQAWVGRSDSGGEVWVSGAKIPQSEASRMIKPQGSRATNAALNPSLNGSENSENSSATTEPKPIEFPPDKTSTVVKGNLPNDGTQSYIFQAAQGQIMAASLEGADITMSLLKSNRSVVDTAALRTQSWTGRLPSNDAYLIQVSGSGQYALEVMVTPPPRQTQEQTQRVTFTPGEAGTTVTGQIAPNQLRRYLLRARQGQVLALQVLDGSINISTIAPNGQRIGNKAANGANIRDWQGRLPANGDYVVEVSAQQASNYALSFEIF